METNSEAVDMIIANDEMNTSERLFMLEKKVQLQNDELTCLKSALADCIRRIQQLESKPSQTLLASSSQTRISPRSIPERPKYEKRPSLTPRMSKANSSTRSSNTSLNESQIINSGVLKIHGRSVKLYSPIDDLPDSIPKPEGSLKLEWVYGYRGKDCRSNLFLLSTGEIVYFIASVAVLYNPEERTQRFYIGHTDDIKCIDVHPNRVHCATGQTAGHDKKDSRPHIRIWDSINLTTLKIIGLQSTEFQNSIACLSFSKVNGDLLAVVDDGPDKVLSLWTWETGHKLTSTKSYSDSVLNCEFHPSDKNIIITSGKQHLIFWTFDGNLLHKKTASFDFNQDTVVQNTDGHVFTKPQKIEKPKFILCMCFNTRGELITGDSNGNLIVWTSKEPKILRVIKKVSDTAIFSININENVLIIGGKCNKLIEVDTELNYKLTNRLVELPETSGGCRCVIYSNKNMLIIGTIKNCIFEANLGELNFVNCLINSHNDEVWGLSQVGNSPSSFLTCANDCLLSYWDSMSSSLVWSVSLEDKLHCLHTHPSLDLVVIGMCKPKWVVYDLIERKLVHSQIEGTEQIEVVKYSPNGEYLAAGSRDNNIYIYKVTGEGLKYTRIGKCSAHSSFITHLDWSVNSDYLMSNSGDYEILFWKVEYCRQVLDAQLIRDLTWASRSCILSMETLGIWDSGSDGTDINACCESKEKELLVSVDDFGKVNLFKYPCTSLKSERKVFNGHSSHVTNCKFVNNDTRLITTGGNDMAIFQWEVVCD